MEKRKAVDLFSEWALIGKDEGMQKGHLSSVTEMLSLVSPRLKSNFSAIDVGCGNGWVCRTLSKDKRCLKIKGIDGSEKMILKAQKIDPTITRCPYFFRVQFWTLLGTLFWSVSWTVLC